MPLKRTEHTSRILHREKCCSPECWFPDRQIRPGMRYFLLTEMYTTASNYGGLRKPTTAGKRHVQCPESDMEKARLRENERR